jgi:hypothetical protein
LLNSPFSLSLSTRRATSAGMAASGGRTNGERCEKEKKRAEALRRGAAEAVLPPARCVRVLRLRVLRARAPRIVRRRGARRRKSGLESRGLCGSLTPALPHRQLKNSRRPLCAAHTQTGAGPAAAVLRALGLLSGRLSRVSAAAERRRPGPPVHPPPQPRRLATHTDACWRPTARPCSRCCGAAAAARRQRRPPPP